MSHQVYDACSNPLKLGDKVYHYDKEVAAVVKSFDTTDEADDLVVTDAFTTLADNVQLCSED